MDKFPLRYRWDSPYDWLTDNYYLEPGVRNICAGVDSDVIQDEFQGEMDETGYFSPICPECDEPMDELDTGEWACADDVVTYELHASSIGGEGYLLLVREDEEEL